LTKWFTAAMLCATAVASSVLCATTWPPTSKGDNAMAFVPVPNTALAEIRMTADLQQVENTLWFEFADVPTAEQLVTLATNLTTWWGTVIQPIVWEGVQLREILCTDESSETGAQGVFATADPTFGELALPPLPTSVSLAVSFRTGSRGRSFRGRNYVVGLVEDQTDGANTFTDAVVSAFQAAYAGLITVASDSDCTWVVASRFSGVDGDGKPIPRETGVTTPITSVLVVDNVVDSQRRRLPGRGR
jgi:hypothetical protein